MGTKTFYAPRETNITKDVIENELCRLFDSGEISSLDEYNKIVVPITVERIADFAFSDIPAEEIVFEGNVTMLGKNAFGKCKKLKRIDISQVAAIGDRIFDGCNNLEYVKLPRNLKEIPSRMFANCKMLKQIELPDSITIIKAEAFINCYSLASIKIPSQTKEIRRRAFVNCKRLKTVTMDDNVTTLGCECFRSCGIESIKLSDNIQEIPRNCFEFNMFTSIKLPARLRIIDDFAFENCHELKELNIPNSVTSIGVASFSLCHRLEKVQLPKALKEIGSYAFDQCSKLSQINLEDVLFLNQHAFMNTALKDIVLNRCTRIEYGCFQGSKLHTVIINSKTLDFIQTEAFYNCSELTTVQIAKVKAIAPQAFGKCPMLDIEINNNAYIDEQCFDD